ncbi:FMN-binding negative transcriptional regulator [Phytohabitans aurantiacus]|uniref:Negative transcriptional regulator n=1 Tax=Phytohabitans aurantiacus TaxID=3016789 RepID=A0ABQ5R5Z3_9ACTN|nr:FMN-binding negative transcriptional regulator [Phytohabitans aurantiacus]GLI01798.1 negative transcriptional regulator [Phytohabitans aurantiacus]
MLEQKRYAITDEAEIQALVRDQGWATLVTGTPAGLAVSHLPVVPESDSLVVLGHLARADADLHELGRHEVALVVQGPHGYISPSWYTGGPYVPTWNFVVAHLYGRPEVLDADETYRVLDRTVDHFERHRPSPWRLDSVSGYAHRIAGGTVGFRLRPDRVVGKVKLSQDKPAGDVASVVAALDRDPTHANPALAEAMRRQHAVAQEQARPKG